MQGIAAEDHVTVTVVRAKATVVRVKESAGRMATAAPGRKSAVPMVPRAKVGDVPMVPRVKGEDSNSGSISSSGGLVPWSDS